MINGGNFILVISNLFMVLVVKFLINLKIMVRGVGIFRFMVRFFIMMDIKIMIVVMDKLIFVVMMIKDWVVVSILMIEICCIMSERLKVEKNLLFVMI